MPSWTNATSPRGRGRGPSPELPRPSTSMPVGVLQPAVAQRYFDLGRWVPDPALATWVEHYWSVSWELPAGTSYLSQVLSHPSSHLTVESGAGPRHGFAMPAVLVHGVVTQCFSVLLEGSGRVFGAKFRPGGLSAFAGLAAAGAPATDLADRAVPATTVFGDAVSALLPDVLAAGTDEERVPLFDAFLLGCHPSPDRRYDQLLEIVAGMAAERGLTSVEQVSARYAVPTRTLQRLFRGYVGIGPKWALQRFRLHDAARLIDEGRAPDLATLAADLGWYDQAHFTRDFADVVGMPPSAYAASAAASATQTAD